MEGRKGNVSLVVLKKKTRNSFFRRLSKYKHSVRIVLSPCHYILSENETNDIQKHLLRVTRAEYFFSLIALLIDISVNY